MTIFQFLRLFQQALHSGLFVRNPYTRGLRFKFASPAARKALGIPEDVTVASYELCPITLVHVYLGLGWENVGNYTDAAQAFGLPYRVNTLDSDTSYTVAGTVASAADTDRYMVPQDTYKSSLTSGFYQDFPVVRETLDACMPASMAWQDRFPDPATS